MDLLDVLPQPGKTKAVWVQLPPELVAEVDAIRNKHRWTLPEVFAYRCRFIETAIRYFMADLPDLLEEL